MYAYLDRGGMCWFKISRRGVADSRVKTTVDGNQWLMTRLEKVEDGVGWEDLQTTRFIGGISPTVALRA